MRSCRSVKENPQKLYKIYIKSFRHTQKQIKILNGTKRNNKKNVFYKRREFIWQSVTSHPAIVLFFLLFFFLITGIIRFAPVKPPGFYGQLTNDPVDVRPFHRLSLQNERNRTNLPRPSSWPSYFIFRTPPISILPRPTSPRFLACLRSCKYTCITKLRARLISDLKPEARRLLRDAQWKRIFASRLKFTEWIVPTSGASYFYFHRIAAVNFAISFAGDL